MWNRWANRIAVCVGGGLFASPFVFSSPSSWRSFLGFPFLIAFPVSFLSFPSSAFLSRFPFTLPPTFFFLRSYCVFVSISGFLVQRCRIAWLGRAIERSWLALPGQNNLGRRGGFADARRAWRPALRRAARTVLLCPFARWAGGWGRDEPAFNFPMRRPDPRSRAGDRNDVDGRPMPGKAKRGFVQQNAGRTAASPGATNLAQNKPGQGWAQGNGRRRAGARGKGKRERGKEKEERGKERKRESMRDVLTSKKNHLKSWRHCLFGCRAAPARRRAIRTFNGRLSACLLIFQRRREALRQERASTLFSDFPEEISGKERAGLERTPQNVAKNKGEKKKARMPPRRAFDPGRRADWRQPVVTA